MSGDTCDLLCLDLPHAEAVRAQLAGEDQARTRANQAKALGDPTRLRIAAALQLRRGAVCLRPGVDHRAVAEPGLPPRPRPAHGRPGHLPAQRQAASMYRLTEAGRRLLAAVTGSVEPLPKVATAGTLS